MIVQGLLSDLTVISWGDNRIMLDITVYLNEAPKHLREQSPGFPVKVFQPIHGVGMGMDMDGDGNWWPMVSCILG